MKIQDKLEILQNRQNMGEWLKIRQQVANEVSDKYSMFCVCGRLCTGFHESSCRRFQNEITNTTIKRLKHLLTQSN